MLMLVAAVTNWEFSFMASQGKARTERQRLLLTCLLCVHVRYPVGLALALHCMIAAAHHVHLTSACRPARPADTAPTMTRTPVTFRLAVLRSSTRPMTACCSPAMHAVLLLRSTVLPRAWSATRTPARWSVARGRRRRPPLSSCCCRSFPRAG